jgi:hypothetical protein
MCVFGRLLLLCRVRFLFFFCLCLFIAFDDHPTNNKKGGEGRKFRRKLCVYYILAGTDSARKHTWARNVNDVYPSTSIVYNMRV